MAPRDKARIVANTREMLAMAEHGYAEAIGADPRRRRPGLMNLFTYGRSVTLAMQTMKHTDPDFDAWYAQAAQDPLMNYFNKIRTDVTHEGELATSNYTVIGEHGEVNMGDLMRTMMRDAPPNTAGVFLGDNLGGNGWMVEMPDGTTEKVYFDLPEGADARSELLLVDPPTQHDGQPIGDTSIANIGVLYLGTLREIVSEFETRFQEP
jgi:hypothetical protein